MVFYCLGCASFYGDEAIYALVSRASVETGVWLPLHVNGNLYLNKPPLKITLVTALFSLFGESEFVARFPDALVGVLTVGLVFVIGVRLMGIGGGLVASLAVLGAENYLCVHGVRDSVQDGFVTLFSLITVFSWAVLRGHEQRRYRWMIVAVLATVAAGLSKNALGVIFAVLVVAIEVVFWILDRRRPWTFVPGLVFAGLVVGAAIAYGLVMQAVTDGAFFVHQQRDILLRATEGVDPGHIQGAAYYLECLFSDFGFWLVLFVPSAVGLARSWNTARARALGVFWIWALGIVAGFSVSVSKLPWYIYPAYPALGLIMGFGVTTLGGFLSSRAKRTALLFAIAANVALDLGDAWERVRADVYRIDSDFLAEELEKFADSTLVIDEWSLRWRGRYREWNRFYLEGAPNARSFREPPIRLHQETAQCLFVATGNPWSYPPTEAHPWRVIMRLRKGDRKAAKIWILGTCDLEVPRAHAAGRDIWHGLISFENFNSGGSANMTIWQENGAFSPLEDRTGAER
jgi:hypothetical protein